MFLVISKLREKIQSRPVLKKWLWFVGLYAASLIVYGVATTGLHLLGKLMPT